MPRLVIVGLMALTTIGCGGNGCRGARANEGSPGAPAQQRAGRSASSLISEMPISVTDAAPLDVTLQLDEKRAVRRVLSTQGGSLEATGADGSTFTLTIPSNALLGEEEIILTPVTAISGLPDGVTLAAGVQLAPDGLVLLKPATMTIAPKTPVTPDQELPVGWTGQGQGIHVAVVAPKPGVAAFQITHFSGVALASASAASADPIIKAPPVACAGQFFSAFGDMVRRARQAALIGEPAQSMESLAQAFIEISGRYLESVLKPIAQQAETDDGLLPCAASAVLTWERQAQLLLSDSFEAALGAAARALRDSIWKGFANVFNAASASCQRDESPLFQLGRMISAARTLELMDQAGLLPGDHAEKIMACAHAFEYDVKVDSEVNNTYNEQGQGIDIVSSKTRLTASGIVARFDEKVSTVETPVFNGADTPAQATVSMVPRHPCPDQVRVQPGSTIGVEIKPIVNVSAGTLRCAGGKAQCDRSDSNPGVLVVVNTQVVENTLLHAYTGERCMPPDGWNEFMMHWTGRTAVGIDQPFQVRGDRADAIVVRYGSSVRRMPVDIPPEILAMKPGMKNYVEINTPAIREAVERTTLSIQSRRR